MSRQTGAPFLRGRKGRKGHRPIVFATDVSVVVIASERKDVVRGLSLAEDSEEVADEGCAGFRSCRTALPRPRVRSSGLCARLPSGPGSGRPKRKGLAPNRQSPASTGRRDGARQRSARRGFPLRRCKLPDSRSRPRPKARKPRARAAVSTLRA